MIRLEPSPHRLIVKISEEIVNDRSNSRIVIPDSAKQDACARYGIVMRVGVRDLDAKEQQPWYPEEGDLVLFHVHESLEVKLDGETYHLLSEEAVLARLHHDRP